MSLHNHSLHKNIDDKYKKTIKMKMFTSNKTSVHCCCGVRQYKQCECLKR